MDKLKKWLFDTEEDDFYLSKQKVVQYEVHNYDLIEKIGEDIKKNYLVICKIDDKCLIRTLDFIEGILFVLSVKEISLSKNIYLFIPECFDYNKFIS